MLPEVAPPACDRNDSGAASPRRAWTKYALPALAVVLFTVAIRTLHRELSGHPFSETVSRIGGIPGGSILQAILMASLGYAALTGYDALALRHIGLPLPYRRTALASFVSYAFSHNLGLTMLGGAPVRFRLYSAWGLSAVEVASVIAFASATYWLGFALLVGLAFLLEPASLPSALHLPFSSARPAGVALLSLVAAYLLLCARGGSLTVRGNDFRVPSLPTAFAQAALAAADWSLAAGVLHALLPPELPVPFPAFLGFFLLAQVGGVSSGVPGGLGVFEGAMVLLLPGGASGRLMAALLAYRLIYYLLPLFLASLLLGGHELLRERAWTRAAGDAFSRWAAPVAPHVFAAAAFTGGAVLLLSGATPSLADRLRILGWLVPLPIVEASHFLGSLAGVALLFLARGLSRRLHGAWLLSSVLLASAILLSLLKGLDYEEALLLSLLLLALAPSRKFFYRRSTLLDRPYSPDWIAAILLVLLASAWVMTFSFRHVPYSSDLWLTFALKGHASRALRATTGAVALAVLVLSVRLLRRRPRRPDSPSPDELDAAENVAARSPDTTAWLALLGDKRLLFNESRTAFVMFAAAGRSFVALGDPAGPEEEGDELAWRFRELVDRQGGWTVFYEVGRARLPLYLDLGLTLVKLGEQARVPLESFSLSGGGMKGLRGSVNRAGREGCRFEVIGPAEVPPLTEELRRVSDAWMARKRTREKGFSLGFFQPAYLSRCPLALVRVDGRIAAFTNLLRGGEKEELSADLMRHLPDAPPGVMDFLFAELMAWGRAEGYRFFNLGMAPLSGLPQHALAPLWGRAGSLLFRHGEHFYNFQGVREFKEKFDPVWEPRYLAAPGRAALPLVLANVAALLSRGWKGVVAK